MSEAAAIDFDGPQILQAVQKCFIEVIRHGFLVAILDAPHTGSLVRRTETQLAAVFADVAAQDGILVVLEVLGSEFLVKFALVEAH